MTLSLTRPVTLTFQHKLEYFLFFKGSKAKYITNIFVRTYPYWKSVFIISLSVFITHKEYIYLLRNLDFLRQNYQDYFETLTYTVSKEYTRIIISLCINHNWLYTRNNNIKPKLIWLTQVSTFGCLRWHCQARGTGWQTQRRQETETPDFLWVALLTAGAHLRSTTM